MSDKESLDWFPDSDTMEDEKSPLLSSAQIQVSGQMVKKADELSGDSSPIGAVFIVVNAALGAGLLTFPYVFFLAGGHTEWYWGVVTEVVRRNISVSIVKIAYPEQLYLVCGEHSSKWVHPCPSVGYIPSFLSVFFYDSGKFCYRIPPTTNYICCKPDVVMLSL